MRDQNLKIQYAKSKIHLQDNTFKKVIFDDNEQYSCRSCLFIHGIEIKEGDCGDVMEDIEKFCNAMSIPFNGNETDRAHGIGKPFLDKEQKKKVRSIIVKFQSWKAHAAFYKLDQKMT